MASRCFSAPLSADPQQAIRRVHLALALLSTAIHGALLLFELTHARQQVLILSVALGISVVLSLLLLFQRVPLALLTTLVSFGLPIWLPLEILRSALSGNGVPAQYYLTLGIVTVVIFGSTAPRRAFILTALMLLGVAATVVWLVPADVPLLLYSLFLIGMIVFVALHGQSVYNERLRTELMQTLAHTDPLTGLLNRRGGEQHVDALLEQEPVPPAAALLLDIDRFKAINDHYGHAVGDEVLIAVAQAIQKTVGPGATVTRWGGEEFLVVWETTRPGEAHALAHQMLEAIRVVRVGQLPGLTASAGLAFAEETGERDAWVNLADHRMYVAKQTGGDRFL